jgi:peptidoglycan/LPS O-acetylase OafA/YrhL
MQDASRHDGSPRRCAMRPATCPASLVTSRHLSKEDVDVYKGVGILLIVLHNYFHWVNPEPGSNEFTFEPDRIVALLRFLKEQPLNAFDLFFSYFGHYGVQIFIFVSAYGLTRTYRDGVDGWLAFMWRRAARIYPTFFLAVVAHAIFVVTFWHPDFVWYLKAYALELSLLSNFWFGNQFFLVGPWWFFSFIFQLYALFPLLLRIAIRHGTAGLIVVGATGLALSVLSNTFLASAGVDIKVTVLGNLTVVCLGIYLARARDLSIPAYAVLAATIVFVAGNWLEPLWYLTPICATVLAIVGLDWGIARMRKWQPAYRAIRYYGTISLPLFAVHGMMRGPFVDHANADHTWYVSVGLGVLFLLAATAAAQLLLWTETIGRKALAPLASGAP